MHGTKLPLCKWLLAMYLIISSGKRILSVNLGKLIGISQKSAWKLGCAIKKIIGSEKELLAKLCALAELDKKSIGRNHE